MGAMGVSPKLSLSDAFNNWYNLGTAEYAFAALLCFSGF